MNNDPTETEFENMLRGLAPAPASRSLVQRVDEELKLDMSWLSTSRRKPKSLPRWIMSAGWAAMGAAAAIAVMSHLPQQQPGAQTLAAAPAPVVLPGTKIREWDAAAEHRARYPRSEAAESRALVVSRELGTWVDPRYGTQLTMEIPSQRQLLPVSYK